MKYGRGSRQTWMKGQAEVTRGGSGNRWEFGPASKIERWTEVCREE